MAFQSQLQIKQADGKRYVRDPIRSKWLVLQPEEWIRQMLVAWLIDGLGVNKNRIAIEKGLKVNTLSKRCDILVYDAQMKPWLLVECKAPDVPLNEKVFRQIAAYNIPLQVPYLLVCNGPQAYACSIDFEQGTFAFLDALPRYGL
ncbi:MAG: type I restriction enzyme HsdR N-terminal domain-containing protein [Saprospiraceae bacterium]